MYLLTTEQSFDAAHFLSNYKGKCSNIHGHRWRVIVEIKSNELKEEEQERGMCVDFSKLKADLKDIADTFDHMLIIEKGSLKKELLDMLLEEKFEIVQVDFRPTAENFSKYFYDLMSQRGYDVEIVQVYETPNNCASYRA